MTKSLETVLAAAKKLNLLDAHGRLVPLDSLALIDMVVELEAAMKFTIPTASLRQESFETLETIAAMLDDLSE